MGLAPYTLDRRYARVVYVTSGHDTEIRLTLEATADAVNGLLDARSGQPIDLRGLLDDHGFTRAAGASAASIDRLERRLDGLADSLAQLPGAEAPMVSAWVNEQLDAIELQPSVTDHDGSGLHIHWTTTTATFDDQIMADVLMAVAQEVCDHGTDRFGTCAADDCEHLFYDATRNGSRRFCSDPRCASRTHTADHRRRQRR